MIERLRAEIAADRDAITRWIAQLESLELDATSGAAVLSLAAWSLHHAYSGVEAILERTMRAIEGSLPEGPDYHRAVLETAGLELEGIRPPLLGSHTVRELHELRAFRHFVRHAYAVELDGRRLAELRERVIALRPALDRELVRLDDWLLKLSRRLDEG